MTFLKKLSWQKLLKPFHSEYSVLGLFFVALFSVRFAPFFFGSTFAIWDNFSLMIPGKMFSVFWLKQGILPMWNPLAFGGFSWIGDINQSLLYPGTLLFMVLNPATALNLSIILHMAVTSVGMVMVSKNLLRSKHISIHVLVALLWAVSQQFTGSLNNLSTLQSMTWTPWVVWAGMQVSGKKGLNLQNLGLFALIVWLQFAGGYPQHVLYSVLLAAAFSLMSWFEESKTFSVQNLWRWIAHWLVAGGVVVAVSAVLWMPFVESLLNSTRVVQSESQSTAGSLEFLELSKVVVPYIFDKPSQGMKWAVSWAKPPLLAFYFSWFGLVLLGARLVSQQKKTRDWWLLGLFVASLLLALGENLPGFSILQTIFPFLRVTRGPSIILMITTFVGAILIGRSAAELLRSQKNWLQKPWVVWAAMLIAVVSGFGLFMAHVWFTEIWSMVDSLLGGLLSASQFHTLERDYVIAKVLLENLVVCSASLGLSFYFWRQKKLWFVLAVIFLDLIYNTQGHLLFLPHDVYDTQNLVAAVSSSGHDRQGADFSMMLDPNARVLIRNYNAPYSDFGAYMDAVTLRSPFSDSYVDAHELQEFDHLKRMRDGLTPDWNQPAGVSSLTGYTTLLPQDVSQRWNTEGSSINRLEEIDVKNPLLSEWSVRYYLVDTWFPIYEGLPDYPVVAEDGYWKLYELPHQPRFRAENGEALEVRRYSETPNQISFEFNIDSTGRIVIADRFDSNWNATINGQAVEIENYHGMRSILVEEGRSFLRMKYFPVWFFIGLGVSAVSSFVMVFFTYKSTNLLISKQYS